MYFPLFTEPSPFSVGSDLWLRIPAPGIKVTLRIVFFQFVIPIPDIRKKQALSSVNFVLHKHGKYYKERFLLSLKYILDYFLPFWLEPDPEPP